MKNVLFERWISWNFNQLRRNLRVHASARAQETAQRKRSHYLNTFGEDTVTLIPNTLLFFSLGQKQKCPSLMLCK